MVKVKHQTIEGNHALYNGDSCQIIKGIPNDSIGFSVFSPPFFDLYSYSDAVEDMSNCKDYAEFFVHFEFLISELFRVMMPGRVVAVHCMDLPTYKRNGDEIGLKDFTGDIIRAFISKGFIYHSRHCIWKDPLIAATRTKAIGLAHKQIVKDSALCRMGIPDYIVAFRKPGENPRRIKHPVGIKTYYGSNTVPRILEKYEDYGYSDNPYDPGKDKRSHWIWQQYASPVWMDIRQTRVLPYRQARDKDDEKHICPLQLDTIERCMELWSRVKDVVLTPFMGVGSEVFVAIKNGRKAIGIELKHSYYKMAVLNVRAVSQKKQLV